MGESRVGIAGMGLATPLGLTRWSTFAALCGGQRITDRLDNLASGRSPGAFELVRGCGQVRSGELGPGDPASNLAVRVIAEAVADAELSRHEVVNMPMIIGSSKGAILSVIENRVATAWDRVEGLMSPHGILSAEIRARTGANDSRCVVGACASGLLALDAGMRMIRRGEHERVLVVATESSLTPMLVASYARLGVLPKLDATGYRGCPLDRNRGGFVLSDGAGAIVLERLEESARSRTGAVVLGTRIGSEAHDLIRLPERRDVLEGLAQWAMKTAGADGLDCVHPHATGTADNDEQELAVLSEAMSGRSCDVVGYGCKGAVGHSLGSSSLVSVVIAAMCGLTGRVPPMRWLTDAIDVPGITLHPNGTTGALRTHAIFAAGFGGHIAGAVLACEPRAGSNGL